MTTADYRIESNQPINGLLWPVRDAQRFEVSDRELAVTLAAKSFTRPSSEIRVVHVPTGEIVFRKQATSAAGISDEV